ncbi:phosphotransferase family protein [Kineococcus terrestris]|uniref:phosphotransferase family protein n=1 Tax=Kineococcus terrestris TaxID=2044856 RepID=UPI0034DB412F
MSAATDGAVRGAEGALDPALPALAPALDDARLRGWAARHGVALPAGARVDRLRWKPGTSVRAAVDPGDGGPWWLLLGYGPGAWGKAGKDLRAAAGRPRAVDPAARAVLVPAAADRGLPALRRHADLAAARPLAHNPARRAVLAVGAAARGDGDGGLVAKVHADTATAARSVRAAALAARAGVAVPAARLRDAHVAEQELLAGAALDAGGTAVGDEVAGEVAGLLRGWWAADPADLPGLPVLAPAALAASVRAALTGPLALPAADLARARDLARRWQRAADRHPDVLAPRVPAHGDLSADQVLRAPDGRLVLLDLDRAAVAPAGWDAAGWRAAATAAVPAGEDVVGDVAGAVLPGPAPHPLLVAAAAALRLPEPFRRRRPDHTARAGALLALAGRALEEVPC